LTAAARWIIALKLVSVLSAVHLAGNGLYEHLEEGCGREPGRLAIDAGEHELRSAVDGDEQEALTAFSATF